MNFYRRLVHDFLDLPHVRRVEVMRTFGLIMPSDAELPENDRYELWFRRAQERGLLAGLRDGIDAMSARRIEGMPGVV